MIKARQNYKTRQNSSISLLNSNNGNLANASFPGREVLQQAVTNNYPTRLVPKEIFDTLSGNYNSIYAPSMRFAQFNIDPLISQRGYQTFTQMLTMGACVSAYNIKRSAVLSEGWRILPEIEDPSNPKFLESARYVDFINYAFNNITSESTGQVQDFYAVMEDMLRASWDGFHAAEICWRVSKSGKYAGKNLLDYIASKPAEEIGYWFENLGTYETAMIMPYTPLDGYMAGVPVEKMLWYVYRPSGGLPYGNGDARAAYKHWLILDTITKLWAAAMERWGSPVLIVKYPIGQDGAMQEAQKALNNIKSGGPAVLPENVEYELVEISSGVLENFEKISDWNTRQISQIVLGNSLTTSEGNNHGSGALGKVHQSTQGYAITSVRRDLEGVINNQLIYRLIGNNFGWDKAAELRPRISLDEEKPSENLANAQALQLLVQMGNTPSRSPIIRQTLNMPPLTPDEEDMLDKAELEAKKAALAKTSGKQKPAITKKTPVGQQTKKPIGVDQKLRQGE